MKIIGKKKVDSKLTEEVITAYYGLHVSDFQLSKQLKQGLIAYIESNNPEIKKSIPKSKTGKPSPTKKKIVRWAEILLNGLVIFLALTIMILIILRYG